MRHSQRMLSCIAVTTLVSGVFTTSALAYTRHPSTPEEQAQTDALNARALANAQGSTQGTTAPSTPMADPAKQASTTQALSGVEPSALSTASVQSGNGEIVGKVQKVEVGSDGKTVAVDVALVGNAKIVALAADELSFDSSRNVLLAELTSDQIKALPQTGG